MKKYGKIFVVGAGVFVLLLVFAVILLSVAGEGILKQGIEKAGSKTLGVGVRLGKLDLSLFKGEVTLGDVEVDNPAGYENKQFLKLGSGFAKADISSVLSDTIHIKKVNLDSVEVVLEQKGLTNNLKELMNGLKTDEKQQEKEQAPGKKLVINDLELTGVKVKAKLFNMPGKLDTVELELGSIHLKNIGEDKAATMREVTSEVLVAIAQGIANKGAGVLPDDMRESVNSAVDATMGLGKKAGGSIKEVGSGVIKGVKGLFKPKKD